MNDLIVTCLLLADRAQFQNMARSFQAYQRQNTPQDSLVALAILLAIAAGLLLFLRFADRYQRSWRQANRPLSLFLLLCRAHRLKWSERWLLWRVGRSQRLREPGRLFLEPERLDPANLTPRLRLQWAQLRALRERLFSEIARDEAATAAQSISAVPPAPLDELANSLGAKSLEENLSVTTWIPTTEVVTEDTGTFSSL